jgi:hypothetical protein
MKIEKIKVADLIPYARNAKLHSEEQVAKIAGSIREFGFCNPVLVDGASPPGIIAGHGRVLAARKLGMDEVPCIRLGHLTEAQKRAYILADNRLAEIGGGWDEELLKVEIEELGELDIDLDAIGFGEVDLQDLGIAGLENVDPTAGPASPYSRKIKAPIYEPKGPKPDISELCDTSKAFALIEKIKASDLPEEEKQFLILASYRHLVFDFGKIAEYYAHSEAAVQRFFEDNTLVIIDFDKAIEQGYVRLGEKILETLQSEPLHETDDEAE